MLSLDGVVAGYGDGVVLHGIDLRVMPGERVGLLGRNGAGKTTLMRAIMGLLPVRAGIVRYGDARLDRLATFEIARLGIAYVPQGRELFVDFTVRQNLELGLAGQASRAPDASHVPTRRGDLAIAWEAFPWLAERGDALAGSLSGGQQQQLAIARALVSRPALLLLDEPLEGIQPSVVDEIVSGLDRLCALASTALLLVEQNTDVVLSLCRRVVFIESGRAVESAQTDALRRDPAPIDRHLGL